MSCRIVPPSTTRNDDFRGARTTGGPAAEPPNAVRLHQRSFAVRDEARWESLKIGLRAVRVITQPI